MAIITETLKGETKEQISENLLHNDQTFCQIANQLF